MKFNKKHFLLSLICISLLFSCGGDTSRNDNKIDIVWVGHSCFEIGFHEYRILIDPFSPESFDNILPRTKYDIVFATHKAQDHDFFDGVEADAYLLASGDKDEFISKRRDEEQKITGMTVRKTATSQFSFWTVASFHDDQHGAVEGVNGIICLDFNGIKVVHLGDLGHALEESHLGQIGAVDVLMIPVDGYFTLDLDTAKAIIRQLAPKIVFPMHYRTESSKSIRPIYTEEDIIAGFHNAKRLNQSHLVIDREILDRSQQIIMLDHSGREDFPFLQGAYLGQKPPGMTAKIFAPGIVSTGAFEHSSPTISPDGNEIYWSVHEAAIAEHARPIIFMRRENDVWNKPRLAEFVRRDYHYEYPSFSVDGQRLYFCAKRADRENSDYDLWFVEKTPSGWSGQRKLGSPPNSENFDAQPSLARNGSVYFISYYDKANPQYGLYLSRYLAGRYLPRILMEEKFNRLHADWTPYIAPDESYLVFSSFRDGGFGSGDLYIAFKNGDGSWSDIINLGDKVNTEANERFPNVTPDGRYLFFNSTRKLPGARMDEPGNGNGDVYWLDAKFIGDLKPKGSR
jgi:L-ascorbate metabolism protein UlaG (beta-lactamase superfamily)